MSAAAQTTLDVTIITGMSGAGRSAAADVLEDLGFFVIDNLPPALIPKVAELGRAGDDPSRFALVVYVRSGEFMDDLLAAVAELRETGAHIRVLFLDAADEVLVRRFEETRRRHPLASTEGVLDGIARERELLEEFKGHADLVVDTTSFNVHELRERLVDLFGGVDSEAGGLQVSIVSFGYKHGLPIDVDLVFDCRFLPNPHWVDELRQLTGLDQPVRDYVLGQPETNDFLKKISDLLGLLLPAYVKEGKSYLSIAIGCTGGHHRSVVLADEIADYIRSQGFEPIVNHRDIER